MRPIRQVIASNQQFKYISVTEDENRMVVRILLPLPKNTKVTTSSSKILSTELLLGNIIELFGEWFKVVAEGCFDRTSRIGKLWWKIGANIQFITNPSLVNRGIISVVSKHDCEAHSYERSTEWLHRIGCQGIAQVYCRSSNDTIIKAAKSFATDSQGKCFTNFDTSRIVKMDSKTLHENKDASKFLVLSANLKSPETMLANSRVTCYVEMYKNCGEAIEKDCNGDALFIDTTAGYIPQRKIIMREGEGQFELFSAGLTPGEEIELQLKEHNGYILAKNIIKVV